MKKHLVLFCVLLASATVGLAEKIDGLPISVAITTSVNYPDGSIEITGTSNSLDDAPAQVPIEIITPGGATINLTGVTDPKTGDYLVKYLPEELGEYSVTAYAPDKVQSANTTFTVTAVIDAEEVIAGFDDAKEEAMTAIDSAITDAVSSGVSAADVAKTKAALQKTKQNLQQFNTEWGKLKGALKELQELGKKYPQINKLAAGDLGQLSTKLNQGSDILRQIQKTVGGSEAAEGNVCNKYYRVAEGCALFSTTMNFASGGIVAVGKSIFIDKVWPKIEEYYSAKSEKANPGLKFSSIDHLAFTQAGKTGLSAADSLASLTSKSFGAGMAGDLFQFVSLELFKKYCTEYKGDISGDYTVEFKDQGKTYLRYKLTYAGRMSVYAPTEKLKGTLPHVSGYIEGNVTKMEFTDDVWVVEDKAEWDEIKNQRIPAPIIPVTLADKDPGFGAVARATTPGSFYFPLEGQIVQEKLVVKLMPARSDFTEAFANRTVVVARAKQEPHNVSGAVFNYPIENAHFILTRSMRLPEDAPVLTLDMKTENGTTTLEKKFPRTESPDADTKVDFNLQLKISNK